MKMFTKLVYQLLQNKFSCKSEFVKPFLKACNTSAPKSILLSCIFKATGTKNQTWTMNVFRILKGNRFVEGLLLEADLATLTEVLSTNLTQIQIQV